RRPGLLPVHRHFPRRDGSRELRRAARNLVSGERTARRPAALRAAVDRKGIDLALYRHHVHGPMIMTTSSQGFVAMKASTRLLASLVVCAAATAAAATLTTRSAAAAGNPSADLDQCANGPIYAPVPCTGTAWQNGNTNANNSHWYEGGSIAYRMKFSSLTPGSTHYVTIQWDTTKGGKHALDYLTAYNRTEVDGNDPCSGVAGCAVPPTTFPIPPDPHVSSLPQPSPDDGRWNQVVTMFNGTIKSVPPYSLTGAYVS